MENEMIINFIHYDYYNIHTVVTIYINKVLMTLNYGLS